MERRAELKRTTPLRRGDTQLARTELARVSKRKLEAQPEGEPKPRSTFKRKGGFTPASTEQRAKVKAQGCRVTADHGPHVQPAHVTPRSLGGCDHPDCTVGLRADLHRLYDMGEDVGLLERLTLEEQAHAVTHLGILGALERTTNERWKPIRTEAT